MSFKIEYFDNVPFKGTCILSDNKLTTKNGKQLTFPDSTGEVALKTDIPAQPDLSNYALKSEIPTVPDTSKMVTTDGPQTLTNKTLTTPTISSIQNSSYTLTVPTKTGTLATTADIPSLTNYVTKTGTETLTNKTLTTPTISTIKNGSYTLTLPSKTATLATTSDGYLTAHQSLDSCVKTSGNQTVAGVKTFSSAPKLSTNTITSSSGNTITLQNKAGTVALTSDIPAISCTTTTASGNYGNSVIAYTIKTLKIGSYSIVDVLVEYVLSGYFNITTANNTFPKPSKQFSHALSEFLMVIISTDGASEARGDAGSGTNAGCYHFTYML